MKTVSCDLCNYEAQGETFEQWMDALKPHYMEAHIEVIREHVGSPEEMKAAMGAWMKTNKQRFDAV